jgi:DNA polymerase
MPELFWDFETRSTVSLEDAGAWRYAADPATEMWSVGYAVDDAEPKIWTPDHPTIPEEVVAAASDPRWIVVAHNFTFERAIATHILTPRFSWPEIPLAQQRCSMSSALASALPGALDKAARALKLDYQKDHEGYLLMRRMSRPRKPRDGEDPNGVYYVDGPELRERLYLYTKHDIETERALYRRLPPLSDFEQRLWQLDALINARGFYTDIALTKAACEVARIEQANINAELRALTNGEIDSVHPRLSGSRPLSASTATTLPA